MKVICAGLSKTGTKSLAKALRILGYNVYDFPEHIDLHLDDWFDAYRGDELPDFTTMYRGVDAVTDIPAAFWYEEIWQTFPNAKVVLNVRDNEEVWLRSWVEHLKMTRNLGIFTKLAYFVWSRPRKLLDFFNTMDMGVYGSVNPSAKSLFRKRYKAHIDRVQRVIPEGKLLVYNVKQGWKPLCQFLGCDVPTQTFPRENVSGSGSHGSIACYGEELKLKIIYFALFPLLFIIVGFSLYLYFRGS